MTDRFILTYSMKAIEYSVAAPDHAIRQCIQRSALFPGRAAGGPKAPQRRRRRVSGVWEGHHRLSSLKSLGLCPQMCPEKKSKTNFEIVYFLHFCKLKCSHLQCLHAKLSVRQHRSIIASYLCGPRQIW